jgi:hypothetical protein
MRKKLLLTGVTLLLIAFIGAFLWWRYGLFSPYNYFTANRDIRNGKIRFVTYGLPMFSSKDEAIDSLAAKYGFGSTGIGCTVTEQEINAIATYNNVIENYLQKRNGKDWRAHYQRQVDSLYQIAFEQDK